MGILSGFFKARDVPKNSLAGGFFGFLGRSAAGKIVTERNSMQVTAVYACVRVITESMASLPIHLYRYNKTGGKDKAVYHPLYFLLQNEPNPEMSAFSFYEAMTANILLWGNAYAQIIRNGRGEILGLYPLMAERMTVDRMERTGEIYYKYNKTSGDANAVSDQVYLRSYEVLHIPGLGFDGLIGYSPIMMAKNAIGLGMAAEEYGSKLYENGATPSGILTHPGVIKEPEKVRRAWHAAYGGSSKAGKTAVLEEGMTYTPISINPVEAQFLETRKFQMNDIARIFRVPPHMIGDLEKSSFSNIEQQSLEFVKYTMNPWVTRWEQSLRRSLLSRSEKREYTIKFNLEGLLRGDYKSRMDGYAIGRQNGWMSANDIRQLEDLDLIPEEEGGDLYLINGNMTKLKDAGLFAGNNGGDNE